MGRILKFILWFAAALVVLLLVMIAAVSLWFDPNDYKDTIAQRIEGTTGRAVNIEGDLGLSLFPWLAVEMGRTEVGNAEGFGDRPFASFDAASLNVRLWPLLTRRELLVGTARLEGLALNLAVDASGRSNWDDLLERQEALAADTPAEEDSGESAPATLDIGSIEVAGAELEYDDRQAGSTYHVRDLYISTGTVRVGEPLQLESSFVFRAEPAAVSGDLELSAEIVFDAATVAVRDLELGGNARGLLEDDGVVPFAVSIPEMQLDTAQQLASPGDIRIEVLDLRASASVQPFSYAGEILPSASLSVDAFSPRSLMQSLGIEAPETADPDALGSLRLAASASVRSDVIELANLEMVLDDTTLAGSIVVPQGDGPYQLDLSADRIELDRYMAPPDEGETTAPAGEEPPLEIPVDLIRSLEARGNLGIGEVLLAGMTFTNVKVTVNNSNGQLRIHPMSAEFFDGAYEGDIRIDATGDVARINANEKVRDVSLAPLAKTLFEQDNITGSLNGTFSLSGSGNDMNEVQRSLDGDLSFSLSDGAYEGVDVWYQLRRARALFRQETPPEPELPPRTPFSEVSATGKVTDGVMRNDDLVAELPFMRLEGSGEVDLVSTEIDYAISGRVFDRPEFVRDASAEELADLTKAVIPLTITGTAAEPKIGVNIESMLRSQVEDKLKDELLKRLGDDEEDDPDKEKDAEDLLKDRLKDLLNR